MTKHDKYRCGFYINGKCAYYCPAHMPNEVRDLSNAYSCKEDEPDDTECYMWRPKYDDMADR
jgi:hypothetical protein